MITDTQSFKVFFLNIKHVINKYIPLIIKTQHNHLKFFFFLKKRVINKYISLIIKTQSLIVKHFAQKHYE